MTRRNTPRISFIGFGEAGQAIASGLRETGIERIAAWDILFPQQTGAQLKAAGEKIGRAHSVVGARRCARNGHHHFGGHCRFEPGRRAFGRAASHRQSLLSRYQFGFARPQAGNRQAARRACPLRRCRRHRGDSPCPAPHASVARPARTPRKLRLCCTNWTCNSRSLVRKSDRRRPSR